jgi:Na+/phosphate symporter
LSPEIALKKIENTLINIGDIVKVDTKNASNLRELESILENIEQEYSKLTNKQKIIKLFEIYRMMNDNNLCQN